MLSGRLRFENSPEVSQTAGISGRGRGRALELAEARAGHLPSVGALAARDMSVVDGAVVWVIEREGKRVLAAGNVPSRVVVRVPSRRSRRVRMRICRDA